MIYAYRNKAGEDLERDFPIGEAPQEITVRGVKYRRVFTLGGINFYGSGFYVNDNSKSPLMRLPRKQRV